MTTRKKLVWWADSLDTLRSFPDPVKQRIGYALDEAQRGRKSGSAKLVPSVGKGVFSLTTDFDSETYRTFYVARFPEAVYVFSVLHKKASKGIGLPKYQRDAIRARYNEIVRWRKQSD